MIPISQNIYIGGNTEEALRDKIVEMRELGWRTMTGIFNGGIGDKTFCVCMTKEPGHDFLNLLEGVA